MSNQNKFNNHLRRTSNTNNVYSQHNNDARDLESSSPLLPNYNIGSDDNDDNDDNDNDKFLKNGSATITSCMYILYRFCLFSYVFTYNHSFCSCC